MSTGVTSWAADQAWFVQSLRGHALTTSMPLARLTGGPEGFEIYHHAYRARLIEVLGSNYPVLKKAWGDDGFDAMALGYVDACPSTHASVRWFGDGLVEHLAAMGDDLPHASLVDLARLDWASGLSFDASDVVPLDFASLAATPANEWPGLRFQAHPSVQWLDLLWDVEPVWKTLSLLAADEEGPAMAAPLAHTHACLVWRQGLQSQWRSVPATEAACLRSCLDGHPFEVLCAMATDSLGEGGIPWLASALRSWVDAGLLLRAC